MTRWMISILTLVVLPVAGCTPAPPVTLDK